MQRSAIVRCADSLFSLILECYGTVDGTLLLGYRIMGSKWLFILSSNAVFVVSSHVIINFIG